MKDQMREAFEAGIENKFLSTAPNGEYILANIAHDKKVFNRGYQAALSAVPAQEPAPTMSQFASKADYFDEVIKRLMNAVGMPNSMSLYQAFKQFQNELAQQPAQEPVCATCQKVDNEYCSNAFHLEQSTFISGLEALLRLRPKEDQVFAYIDAFKTAQEPNIVMGSTIQKLGARLADLLDEDQFKECESLLLDIAQQPPQEPIARVADVHMSRYTLEWIDAQVQPEGTFLYLQSQAQQPTKELFSLYSAVNNLVAHIGMVGEITSKHDLVDAVMNSLYDLDGGSVAKRADDLIEKAFMPQSQALKLAVNEYIAKESK